MNILTRALRTVCHLQILKLENCGLSGRAVIMLGIYRVTIFFYALENCFLHLQCNCVVCNLNIYCYKVTFIIIIYERK